MPRPSALITVLAVPFLAALAVSATADEPLTFGHVFDDSPLNVTEPRSGETFTEAVLDFHRTGANSYNGDTVAEADGGRLYNHWCQACHMPDGSGRIGPPLVDGTYRYERVGTDKGEFEVIYGGAAGAMQGFGRRLDQDDILKIMAYVEVLKRR